MTHAKDRNHTEYPAVTRRDLLKVGLGGSALSMTTLTPAFGRDSNARGHIVIVGAGAGGLALANRLATRLPLAEVSLVDSKPKHWYQPGLTMVASGLWHADDVISDNSRWVPTGINWVQARVTRFEARQRRLHLDSGDTLSYGYLVAIMNDREATAEHNGYTSCPLITGIGKAMLVEFGYGGVMLPSFPFIDPKDESWAVWIMKDRMLKPAYYAMLEGHI